ncbi:MAG: helix-turn-helix domain-containing protein, partial [Verrucomicrobiia bacterium]
MSLEQKDLELIERVIYKNGDDIAVSIGRSFERLEERIDAADLCEQFGISRKTGYKHLDRYAADGLKGLAVRSHRPHQFPQRTDAAVEALILAERRLHRTWGPKKLHKVLEVKHGIESPPARSTIGEILRRHG